MKLYYSFLFVCSYLSVSAQVEWNYTYTFEDSMHVSYLEIPENPLEANIWQVGIPQKTVFASSLSIPKVIVTDTIHSYPANNTSTFELTHYINMEFRCQPFVSFDGYYQSDTDEGTDFGTIELSPDNGLSWINLTEENQYTMMSQKPVLTGNSNGWQYFYYDLTQLFYEQNLFGATDTVKFRFSFFSDSIDNPHDGLMFDELHFFSDDGMGLASLSKLQAGCYPNPAQTTIQFPSSLNGNYFELHDYLGNLSAKGIIEPTLNVQTLSRGIYFMKILNGNYETISVQKIMLE